MKWSASVAQWVQARLGGNALFMLLRGVVRCRCETGMDKRPRAMVRRLPALRMRCVCLQAASQDRVPRYVGFFIAFNIACSEYMAVYFWLATAIGRLHEVLIDRLSRTLARPMPTCTVALYFSTVIACSAQTSVSHSAKITCAIARYSRPRVCSCSPGRPSAAVQAGPFFKRQTTHLGAASHAYCGTYKLFAMQRKNVENVRFTCQYSRRSRSYQSASIIPTETMRRG